MLRKKDHDLEYFQFELFSPYKNLLHASFLRNSSPNADFYKALTPISARQVHSKTVHVVKAANEPVPECDALITNLPNIALLIKHADCQAALFFDPVHNAIGAVHSGWRGSVQNIYHETVEAMKREYGTSSQDLLVAISPSLGPDAAEFKNYQVELPEEFYPFQKKPLYFDFWKISRMQLEKEGVLPEHIQMAELCTFSNPADFHSYRRDKTTERHITLIALTNQQHTK